MSQIIVDSETNLSLTNKLVADDTVIDNIDVGSLVADSLVANSLDTHSLVADNSLKVGSNGTTVGQLLIGTGTITFTNVAQYQQASATITFASAFSTPPAICIQVTNGGAQPSAVILSVNSVTTTGCTVDGFYTFTSNFTGTVNFKYIAIG